MKKWLFIIFVCVFGATFVFKDKEVFTKAVDLNEDSKAVILIEAETGKIIYEKNSTEPLPIASMSKLMTQYLVLNAIENGTISWETASQTDGLRTANG